MASEPDSRVTIRWAALRGVDPTRASMPFDLAGSLAFSAKNWEDARNGLQ